MTVKRSLSPGGNENAAVKKFKRVQGTALPIFDRHKAIKSTCFPLDAKLRRTKTVSKSSYLNTRCNSCDGLTVRKCLDLKYKLPSGMRTKYTVTDLRYDIQGGRLKLHGGNLAGGFAGKAQSQASALPKLPRGNKALPIVACKHTSGCKSLSGGVRLPSGTILPAVGFGTYKLKNEAVEAPVLTALKSGYRLIDTAQVYENEQGVGAALRKSGLARDDVFIETKVWRSSHGYDRTIKACNASLKKLGVDHIDLYVIHWPGCKTGWPLKKGTTCPSDWTPAMRDTGTWRAMEDLYTQGKVKAIGVTNYSIRHLKQLLKSCRIKPMVNQVEFHPRLVQTDLLKFCQKHNVAVQAYASLGSGDKDQAESFFAFPPVCKAAKAHKVSPAQVLLRWALQKGCHIVPKSVKAERVAENSKIFSFKLTVSEMKAIDSLHTGARYAWKGVDPDTVK